MAFATIAAAQGVLTEAPIPPSEPVSTKESTHAEGVVIREFVPISVEIPTPLKDGSSLVLTPSSFPSSATQGPDADLSSNKGSEEVLEDLMMNRL